MRHRRPTPRREHPSRRHCCRRGGYEVLDDLDATARAATYLNGRLVALLEATIFLGFVAIFCFASLVGAVRLLAKKKNAA